MSTPPWIPRKKGEKLQPVRQPPVRPSDPAQDKASTSQPSKDQLARSGKKKTVRPAAEKAASGASRPTPAPGKTLPQTHPRRFALRKLLVVTALLAVAAAAGYFTLDKLNAIQNLQTNLQTDFQKNIARVEEGMESIQTELERLPRQQKMDPELQEQLKVLQERLDEQQEGLKEQQKQLEGIVPDFHTKLGELFQKHERIGEAPQARMPPNPLQEDVEPLSNKLDGLLEASRHWVSSADLMPVSERLEKVEQHLTTLQWLPREAESTRENIGQLETQLRNLVAAIRESHDQQARQEHVALVLFHSSRLDMRPFAGTVRKVVDESDYRYFFENYLLSVALARDGTISEWIIRPDPEEPIDLTPFSQVLNAPSNVSNESVNELHPEEVFEPQELGTDLALRMVVICSTNSQPPDPAPWQKQRILVHAILIDESGQNKAAGDEAWKKWEEFCAATSNEETSPFGHGEVELIRYRRESGVPADALRRFHQALRTYLRPVPP